MVVANSNPVEIVAVMGERCSPSSFLRLVTAAASRVRPVGIQAGQVDLRMTLIEHSGQGEVLSIDHGFP